jgi:hypothetical protein
MPAPSPRYIRCRAVREERVDDALFLIDHQGQAIHMLEGASSGLWNILVEPISAAEAKSLLKIAFPAVPPKRIARDVEALFSDLAEAGLIEHVR